MSGLTHLDGRGQARMVDVTGKAATYRTAEAAGEIRMAPATLAAVRSGAMEKGDVLAVARIAGIQAAKRCWDWIPLCHPLSLTGVGIGFVLSDDPCRIEVRASVRCTGPTGVEMEALTAVSAALLTIYDMCKAVQRDMTIGEIRLLRKTGGASGTFVRDDGEAET